jgi:hypothetical protein
MRFFTTTSTLLFTASAWAQIHVPEVEPNDTAAQAQALALGSQVDGTLVAGESDWYSFTTTSAGQMRLTTSGLDTRIVLWDATGLVGLGINDDCRALFSSDITINLPAATYTVQVVGFTAATAGNYSLDVALPSASKPFTVAEVEPNDTTLDSGVFTLANGAQISGSLGSATDVDVYRIVVSGSRSGVWLQVTEGDAPWVSQHRYEILDSSGALLTPTATLGANAGDSSTLNFRTSQIRCWPAGTYHFVVRNRSVAPAANLNPVPLGNYRLEFLELPMNTGAAVAEAPALDTNGQVATAIAPGQQGIGNLAVGNEIDLWGPITFATPSVLQFQTAQGAISPVLDTSIGLRFFDPLTNTLGAATLVTAGNILDPTSHARGTFSFFLAPSSYYIEVRSPGTAATQIGNYRLEISAIDAAPYVAASYATLAANAACGTAPQPTLTRDFTNEVPTIGQTFVRRITGLTPSGFALLLFGTEQILPISGPLAVDPVNCFMHITFNNGIPFLLDSGLADPAGVFTSKLLVPPIPNLRGLVLWEQAAELLFPAFQIEWGNFARILIGERSY